MSLPPAPNYSGFSTHATTILTQGVVVCPRLINNHIAVPEIAEMKRSANQWTNFDA